MLYKAHLVSTGLDPILPSEQTWLQQGAGNIRQRFYSYIDMMPSHHCVDLSI